MTTPTPSVATRIAGAILCACLAAPVYSQIINEELKLLPTDGAVGDQFGRSVAISGNTVIVGAPFDDDYGTSSGSAFLFDVATGQQLFKLLANDGAAGDRFGYSVAIDADIAIVGARGGGGVGHNSGAAYLFDVATGQQIAKLLPNDGAAEDFFGLGVAICGNIAIVSSPLDDDNGTNSGSAYLFNANTGQQIAKLLPSDGAEFDQFGISVAISGNTAIVGARVHAGSHDYGPGAAYLFDVTTGQQISKLLPADGAPWDRFGYSVAISGNIAIIGAPFQHNNYLTQSGSAYLFDVTTGQQIAKFLANDAAHVDQFGISVAISGNTAVIGAHLDDDNGTNSGSAYLFNAATGQQIAKVLPSDGIGYDFFGYSVAVSGKHALIGAYAKDSYSGSAYLFIAPCPGDINGDGIVDLNDFVILAGNFGFGPGATPQQGDLNSDGFVNLNDFVMLAGNFGRNCN